MKSKKLIITLIAIISVLAIGLVGVMVFGIVNNSFSLFGFSESTNLISDELFDNSFDMVEVNSEAGKITVRQSEDDKIRVVIYSEVTPEIENGSGKLLIDVKTQNSGFLGGKTSRAEIYLPSDFDKKLTVSNKYGDINIGDFVKSNIKVNADCGDVNVGSVMSAEISENLGNIKVDNVTRFLNLKNNCGNIEVGSLQITEDSVIENDLGNISVGNTNKIFIDAKCDLGNMNIKNNYRTAEVTLRIKNDCGNIDVNN